MCRHFVVANDKEVYIGYDRMGLWPGYFCEVYSDNELIGSIGVVVGVSAGAILEFLREYSVLEQVKETLPDVFNYIMLDLPCCYTQEK